MKRGIMFFLAICLVLVLGACAPRQFCHRNPSLGTPERFERDKYICDLQANQYAHQFGASGNIFVMKSKYDECMRLRGWTPCKRR